MMIGGIRRPEGSVHPVDVAAADSASLDGDQDFVWCEFRFEEHRRK